MPLPTPARRETLHTRTLIFECYARDDGLWDIEGHLVDTKAYPQPLYERGELPPGTPIHDLALRVTVDDQLVIREIAGSMDDTPLGECLQAQAPLQKMLGVTLGPGLRQAIDRALGGTQGCTHFRELLVNAATAAYQAVPHAQARKRRLAGLPDEPVGDRPPFHVGRCIAWDVDGSAVARYFPQFSGWEPLRRVTRRGE